MAVHWTIVDEIRLLRWASEFKPAGIHKHFHMFCIVERMNSPDKYPVTLLQKETMKLGKVFTAKDIWEKLSQSYNLEDIDEMEHTYSMAAKTDSSLNDNDIKNDGNIHEETLLELNNRIRTCKKNFTLPWDEYGELILENAKKDPISKKKETQIEHVNDKNSQISQEVIEDRLKNVRREENKDSLTEKVEELNERHTKAKDSLTDDSHKEITIVAPTNENAHETEHTSDGEHKEKTSSKTIAPVRKSQRLKRNKEVKFEDERIEEKEKKQNGDEKEEDKKDKEEKVEKLDNIEKLEKVEKIQKVQKVEEVEKAEKEEGKTQNDNEKLSEEKDGESNDDEEDNDEREKSSSYENTNGSESEEVDEAPEYGSDHEREDKEKSSEPERDDSKRKTESPKEDDQQDGIKENGKVQHEPLAKRTRHSSSAGNTSNETSPTKKKRKVGSRKDRTPATRVSSRLRNKK
ncbi:eaf7p [Saccharomyces arboricola H-6]|uniref:Chromatin modification-related protein EAF7 n=1 Tax=Saccharomyces arboricola (strain H-6 / AS 2.3317 / CBS 10644) TaxID=1160507 RepID=J8LIW9_SACAR|nr:eaf7p [Saccharomyces arboricola H-6]